MIAGLARVVTDFFLRYGAIDKRDAEIYQYGNEIIISSVIDLLIVFIIGAIFNGIIYSILFFVPFFLLRKSSGGYHAESYFKCKLIFTLNILIILLLINQTDLIYNLYSMILLLSFSVTVIVAAAPIESNNKPLTEKDIQNNSKKAKITVSLISLLILIVYNIDRGISLTLLLSLFSVSVAMIIELIRKGGIVHEDDEENCRWNGQG